jgi:hypothetical protein
MSGSREWRLTPLQDHILELQIVKAALAGEVCTALNGMINIAKAEEINTDGCAPVKKSIMETLILKLNADARNLYFLPAAENGKVRVHILSLLLVSDYFYRKEHSWETL